MPWYIPGFLLLWESRIAAREALRDMDQRALADTGISRAEADHEAGKPFWAA